MENRKEFYSARVKELEAKVAEGRNRIGQVSRLRLLLMALVAVSVYASFSLSLYFLFATGLLIALFLRQVKRHAALREEFNVWNIILRLNEEELKLLKGDKSVFDTGADVDCKGHLFATDLDIFGVGSLFQTINRTSTKEGRRILIDTLLNLPVTTDTTSERKPAIQELEREIDWRQHFFAVGALSGEKERDLPDFRTWINQPAFYSGFTRPLWLARVMTAFSVLVIGGMIVTLTFSFPALILLVVVNQLIMLIFSQDIKRLNQYFILFGSKTSLFNRLSALFAMVAQRNFTTPLNQRLQSEIKEASASFLDLYRLANLADQRLNNMVGPIMNILFLFDAWTILKIERWRIKNQAAVDEWIAALATIDMLNSCANFKFNHPGFCEPSVTDGVKHITASEMGHPLLSPEVSITNDYEIGATARAHIITGSNMAGKSTFIRAVGLNVVLALNGLPVCATSFSCSVMQITSCIRINDSLEENASYFKAELNRLAQIMDVLKTGASCLVLLDEILRGTNSDDKRQGTLAFFRKLSAYNCIALLATHDLNIGELEKEHPAHFRNFCFESTVDQIGIHFDYKLHSGVSRSANATYLMKNMGLID